MAIRTVGEVGFHKIDAIPLSGRLKRFKDRYLNETARVSGDRARLAVEGWKETEGEPLDLRRAKLLKKVCQGVPVVIHEGELLIGSQTRFFRGAYPDIEWDAERLRGIVDGTQVTFGSPENRGAVSDEDWQAIAQAVLYFRGKTPGEAMRQTRNVMLGSWYEDVVETRGISAYESNPWTGFSPLFQKVLEQGLRGIIAEAQAAIGRFTEMRESDPQKLYFWQAVIIACESAITLAKRYAQAARELAASEQDAARRKELEDIAAICEHVPENPARSFHEALQSMRLVTVASILETDFGGKAMLGRLDQYLYPYFKRDLDGERLTLEKAAELLGEFISWLGRLEHIRDKLGQERVQNTPVNHITLGGVTREGEDASNELSYLILHVLGLLRYAEPHATIRWHPGTPRWLWMKAFDTNRKVAGIPMYVNDGHVIEYMLNKGVPLAAARDWSMQACASPVVDPQRQRGKPTTINVALILDLALHNGLSPVTGKRIGVETGDPRAFTSFEQLYQAFKKQHEFVVRRLLWATRLSHWAGMQRWRLPLRSALLPGCIENGKDFSVGGSGSYPIWYVEDRGSVDTADSLMAIKKLVFDDKKLSMGEMLDALDSDFEGDRGEEVRQMCLAAPKYGNDIDEADYLLRDVAKFSASIIMSEKNPFGSPYTVNRHGVAWHYFGGKGVGALPNGHKAREPLDDGSLSPMRGADKFGPTAVLKSALKADFKEAAISILNQKFPLALVQSPEALEKVASLTETFLRNGGSHIQYNFLDRQVLLEAKKHPEQYKDLVVRVAGYSAYFVLLTPEVQDDIIARTEQCL